MSLLAWAFLRRSESIRVLQAALGCHASSHTIRSTGSTRRKEHDEPLQQIACNSPVRGLLQHGRRRSNRPMLRLGPAWHLEALTPLTLLPSSTSTGPTAKYRAKADSTFGISPHTSECRANHDTNLTQIRINRYTNGQQLANQSANDARNCQAFFTTQYRKYAGKLCNKN